MYVILQGVANCFAKFCNVRIPINSGWSIPVYVFFAAGLGITLAFKLIRGLFG